MKTFGSVGLLFLASVAGACFDTPKSDIAFVCGPADECPDGYECRNDGCCHLAGSDPSATCALVDASPMADAMIDAMADAAIDAAIDAAVAVELVDLSPMSATVAPGGTVTLTVTLSAPAPAGGSAVALASGDPAIATVPAEVTVPQGMTQAMFSATAQAPGMTTVSATLDAVTLQSTLTVTN